jgi:hypothetical protein
MDINKVAGGNIIPQGATEAFKKVNEDASTTEKKPLEVNTLKEQDKGARLDVQA